MGFFSSWRLEVTYTHEGLADSAAGAQYRNKVRIRPEYIDDPGLLAHESIHVKQWQMCTGLTVLFAFLVGSIGFFFAFKLVFGLLLIELVAFACLGGIACAIAVLPRAEEVHGWLYRNKPRYRLWAEVQAYRDGTLHHYPDRLESIAAWMASDLSGYNFNIDVETARQALLK